MAIELCSLGWARVFLRLITKADHPSVQRALMIDGEYSDAGTAGSAAPTRRQRYASGPSVAERSPNLRYVPTRNPISRRPFTGA